MTDEKLTALLAEVALYLYNQRMTKETEDLLYRVRAAHKELIGA